MRITIVLADDHELVRQSIGALLRNEPDFEVLDECSSGSQILESVSRSLPAVAIVDVAMSGLDGIETTKRIMALSPDTRVIVLSSYSDAPHVRGLLAAGVSAYILKSGPAQDLIQAVRCSSANKVHLSPEVADLAEQVGDFLEADKASANGVSWLSPRQLEVLRLIAEGYSTKRISSTLGISATTVKSHRKSIMEKLDIHDKVLLTRHAIRIGLTRGG